VILGNNKKFKGVGLVSFIDVLGFSNDILKNWNNTLDNPLEKILSIKKDMPINSSIEDDGRRNHRTYVSRVNTVSDSVTICFGYNEEIIAGDFVLGIESVIANISYVWSTFISKGYTIRGAIDFGDIYWDETELIGPAFINAYKLESEVAKCSRVIISSRLNKNLRNLFDNHERIGDKLLNKFRKDVDGYVIVNPTILYRNNLERVAMIDNLIKMRDAIPSGIIREKYNPLISMLSDDSDVPLKKDGVGRY
jgi:hypothetical protein